MRTSPWRDRGYDRIWNGLGTGDISALESLKLATVQSAVFASAEVVRECEKKRTHIELHFVVLDAVLDVDPDGLGGLTINPIDESRRSVGTGALTSRSTPSVKCASSHARSPENN